MRQNVKDRLNKKLVSNNMTTLHTNKVEPAPAIPIEISEEQQEELNEKVYTNYATLQEVEPYPGHLQAIIQDDGKLFMVLLFIVGGFVIHQLIKSKNICEANRK